MRKTPIQEVIKDIDLIISMWNDPSNEMDFNHTMEVFRSRCIEKLEDEKKFTEKWFDRGMNWKKSPINFEQSWNELYNTKEK